MLAGRKQHLLEVRFLQGVMMPLLFLNFLGHDRMYEQRRNRRADNRAETERRRLSRTDWAYVHQNPRDGLRMDVSAGGNVGERLMDRGVTINRPPRDGRMAFVRSPDNISVELLQKGTALPLQEPWTSMPNIGAW